MRTRIAGSWREKDNYVRINGVWVSSVRYRLPLPAVSTEPNPYTSHELEGEIAAWGNNIDTSAGKWYDDLENELHLDLVGPSLAEGEGPGGPGSALPDALFFGGNVVATNQETTAGAHAEYPDPEEPLLNLGASNGAHWIAFWVKLDGTQGSWSTVISKGDTTYQSRMQSHDNDNLAYDVRGGTGGNVNVRTGMESFPNGPWVFVFLQQTVADGIPNRIWIFLGGPTPGDEVQIINSSDRTGTVGTNTASKFTIGVQDNDGTLRRWLRGWVAGVRIGTANTDWISNSAAEELRLKTFEEWDPSGSSGGGGPAGEQVLAAQNNEVLTSQNDQVLTNSPS